MAVEDLARMRIHTIQDSQVQEVGLGFRSFSVNPLWRSVIAEEWIASVAPWWFAPLSSDVELLEVAVDDVKPGTAPPVIVNPPVPRFGAQPVAAVPQNTAALLAWYTERQGRSFTGRSYIPGLARYYVRQCRFLEDEAMSLLAEAASRMMARFGPDGISLNGEFVVISRRTGGSVRPVPISTPVLDYTVKFLLGTQRLRLL